MNVYAEYHKKYTRDRIDIKNIDMYNMGHLHIEPRITEEYNE